MHVFVQVNVIMRRELEEQEVVKPEVYLPSSCQEVTKMYTICLRR